MIPLYKCQPGGLSQTVIDCGEVFGSQCDVKILGLLVQPTQFNMNYRSSPRPKFSPAVVAKRALLKKFLSFFFQVNHAPRY